MFDSTGSCRSRISHGTRNGQSDGQTRQAVEVQKMSLLPCLQAWQSGRVFRREIDEGRHQHQRQCGQRLPQRIGKMAREQPQQQSAPSPPSGCLASPSDTRTLLISTVGKGFHQQPMAIHASVNWRRRSRSRQLHNNPPPAYCRRSHRLRSRESARRYMAERLP